MAGDRPLDAQLFQDSTADHLLYKALAIAAKEALYFTSVLFSSLVLYLWAKASVGASHPSSY